MYETVVWGAYANAYTRLGVVEGGEGGVASLSSCGGGGVSVCSGPVVAGRLNRDSKEVVGLMVVDVSPHMFGPSSEPSAQSDTPLH